MTKLTFSDFAALAESEGLQALDRGHGHWQVRGKIIVNYYPHARRGPTIYINGTRQALGTGTPAKVMKLANSQPPLRPGTAGPRPRPEWVKRQRARLFKRDPRCHWCRAPLTLETATLEHIIPRARGGSDYPDNLTLACLECNFQRGCDMKVPPVKEQSDGLA